MKSSTKISSKRKPRAKDPLAGDLSYLFNGTHQAKRVSFELKPKNKVISIRMSEDLLNEVKDRAEEVGVDYQKWIRIALEEVIYKKAV